MIRFLSLCLFLLIALPSLADDTHYQDHNHEHDHTESWAKNVYFGLGATYSFLDKSLQVDDGDAFLLVRYRNAPVLYSLKTGYGRNGFRMETELFYNQINVHFTRNEQTGFARDSAEAGAKFEFFGGSFNILYDIFTLGRITPYLGASFPVSMMRLKIYAPEVFRLRSPLINLYLSKDSKIGASAINGAYGFGAMGGLKFKITEKIVLDASYRFSQMEKCFVKKGCALIRRKQLHEARVHFVVLF